MKKWSRKFHVNGGKTYKDAVETEGTQLTRYSGSSGAVLMTQML